MSRSTGLILAFIVLAASTMISCADLGTVRDTLNEQRALYDLPPVFGDTCEEVAYAFVDYEPLVTTAVDPLDSCWETITASECRTFRAHLDAFAAMCEPYVPTQHTVLTCMTLEAWE